MTNRLNLHIDESGSQDLSEGRYIVAVVLHEHSDDIGAAIARYEERLSSAGLPDIPFHGKDLLRGNEGYRTVSPGDRKRLLAQFARFVRELPVAFFTLKYDGSSVHGRDELESRIRRDLASLVFDKLAYFQGFEAIAVYYDNGQGAVSAALHDALDFVLARNVADYRDADPAARRLLQAADYICTVARISDDYDAGRQSRTHERFFGSRRNFTQSFKKQLDRKQLSWPGQPCKDKGAPEPALRVAPEAALATYHASNNKSPSARIERRGFHHASGLCNPRRSDHREASYFFFTTSLTVLVTVWVP